ncbi:MAG: TIR domain-containing protein [Phycisphaerales bacterium]|nr:TIR domain-containing protein [Phycisphaerales bacterium]
MIRAFLSFVEEDLNLVNLFRGQAKNQASDIEFADFSIKIPFDSLSSGYVARGLADQIKLVALTICLCGPTTYTSKWVDWELRKTMDLGKPIMGVYLYNPAEVPKYPEPLAGHPLVPWNINEIVRTMRSLVVAKPRGVKRDRAHG